MNQHQGEEIHTKSPHISKSNGLDHEESTNQYLAVVKNRKSKKRTNFSTSRNFNRTDAQIAHSALCFTNDNTTSQRKDGGNRTNQPPTTKKKKSTNHKLTMCGRNAQLKIRKSRKRAKSYCFVDNATGWCVVLSHRAVVVRS